jgi:hypothetical protein
MEDSNVAEHIVVLQFPFDKCWARSMISLQLQHVQIRSSLNRPGD